MATIKFLAKSDIIGKQVSLYIRMKDGNVDLSIVSPIKVYPEYWDNLTERFKKRITFNDNFSESEKLNLELEISKLKNYILKSNAELNKSALKPNKIWLESTIAKFYDKGSVKVLSLNEYIDSFINSIESGDRLFSHNGKTKKYEKGTIKNFKGFRVQFLEFQKKYKKNISFNNISIDFYNDFVKFFMQKDYSLNTIGRHIKNLKTIMHHAKQEGLHFNNEIDNKNFKILKTRVDNIYLTETELLQISNLELQDKPSLDIVRDVFLVGCYTAQRFSDYSKIKKTHIKVLENGKKVLDFIQQKTGERVIIPIKPELERILCKYDFELPKTYEQKLNQRIKVIGEMAGICQPIFIEENKGGHIIKSEINKNELIKTHTARRTGCTLMYLAAIPSIDIMKISGHKTESEFLNYIKIGKEETALNLANHPYFK